MSTTTPATIEWAIRAKRPNIDRGYSIIAWSQGDLNQAQFEQIVDRFSPGTPNEATAIIGWAGHGDETRVVVAINRNSKKQDAVGRQIGVVRCFTARYEELARGPVSYRTLLERAYANKPEEGTAPFQLDLPVMRPEEIATRITPEVKASAALLLEGKQVCVVGADGVTTERRLDHLDSIAAALPYGLRGKLSASTWTSATALHSIRLSFSDYPRSEFHNVTWGQVPTLPAGATQARRYLELLDSYPPEELVTRLAGHTQQLSFNDPSAIMAALAATPEVQPNNRGLGGKSQVRPAHQRLRQPRPGRGFRP